MANKKEVSDLIEMTLLNNFENEILVIYGKFQKTGVNESKLHNRFQQIMHKLGESGR